MPKEELRKLPYLDVLPKITDLPRGGGVFFASWLLNKLEFYFGIPKGEETDEFQKAVSNFQRSLKAAPTGALTMGEFEELGRRANFFDRGTIALPGKSIVASPDFVLIEGTWVIKDGQMTPPLNASHVTCSKQTRRCDEAFSKINQDFGGFGPEATVYVYIGSQQWQITKWTSDEIIAESDDPMCAAYTLSVNIRAKTATQFRRAKGGGDCERIFGGTLSPLIIELADGFNVAWDYERKVREEGAQYLNPKFRKQMEHWMRSIQK